jgi:hypothetical protein
MHHTIKLYSRYRELFLRFYILMARLTRLPLIEGLVRRVANLYGKKRSAAYLLTLDEAKEIMDIADGLALGPCDCRVVFRNCDNPVNTEIMLGLSRNIFIEERPHNYQEITTQEAKDVLEQCHQRGLIPTIVKCQQDFYAICNCCSCCCVPLRLNKQYGIGNALVRNDSIVREFKQRQKLNQRLETI